jgi:hypothetical protein
MSYELVSEKEGAPFSAYIVNAEPRKGRRYTRAGIVLPPGVGKSANATSLKGRRLVLAPNKPLIGAVSIAAICVSNEDCSPVRIHSCDAAITPSGFAEIVSD